MVDQFSRFTLGVVIKNRELATISEAVMINWIGAGYPRIKNIHTDSGGESCGDASNKMEPRGQLPQAEHTIRMGRAREFIKLSTIW